MSNGDNTTPPDGWKKPDWLPPAEFWIRWGGWIVAVLLAALLSYYGIKTPIPPPPLEPEQEVIVPSQGWIENPAEVDKVVAALPIKGFQDTPAARGTPVEQLPDHVYLWDAYRKFKGVNPPSKNQKDVGSCVSFGTNNAIERTMSTDIALLRKPYEFKFICEEVTYGGSRVEVGGGRIRGDGSVGAWAADFVRKWGVVSREVHGQYDLRNYDTTRCRDFGRNGVPQALEEVAKQHPVLETTQVKDWTSAKKALANGYGIAICSGQGFSMQRDSRGVARASGSWAHCMCLDGYHIENGQEYGHIENSWGASAHTGPVGWGDPPTSGFWAESGVINRMLGQDDSWAFSGVKGFPKREIDWFVRGPEPRINNPWLAIDLEPVFALAP